jgi:acetyl esterase/lipase
MVFSQRRREKGFGGGRELRQARRMQIMNFALMGWLAAGWAVAQPGVMPRAPYGGMKPTFEGVAYAGISEAQKLDLFLPDGDGPFPLVINIHGGAFRFGERGMLDAPIAKALLKEGIAVASIDYRLSGEAKFPAAVLDAKAAVRFLRANASKYRLDGGKFIAFGQSAGGNLASLLGTSGGVAEFDDPALGNSGVSSRVQGVIDWFGPTDFLKMDAQAAEQGCPAEACRHGEANSPEGLYLGSRPAVVPQLAAKANPITFITPDDPPFLLQKGEKDCVVPVGQSRILLDALKTGGVKAELDILEGAGHGDMGSPQPKFLSAANVARVVGFVKSVVGR